MKQLNEKRKNGNVKTLLAATIMVGTVTLTFSGLTQVAAATENNKSGILPTAYQVGSPVANTNWKTDIDGYVKPNYTIIDNNLEYYRDKKPTANDISRDEAADIGVQALSTVFGLDLNGKTIEMSYDPAHDLTRAKWSGEFWSDGQKGPTHPIYVFYVDAVTGEVYGVGYSRTLSVKTDVGYDSELAKNPSAMEAVAKKYAEELNVVGGPVKSSTIASQGYSSNDPTVNFRIVGENGKLAIIEISRYDKALLAVSYHNSVLELDAEIAQLEKDAENPSDDAVPMEAVWTEAAE